jgi:hypothetical protein
MTHIVTRGASPPCGPERIIKNDLNAWPWRRIGSDRRFSFLDALLKWIINSRPQVGTYAELLPHFCSYWETLENNAVI